ncbi:hypothetical protein [Shewanella nanhaiensis]|uniref:Uncharacterized protein n=1 Tax=Shewanella nanhaiensis TaxID=2864872 RepID=A0ABS7E3Q0_9GAMM|nr:hypothetical protein [Shewanella nanhaiensis]MBW8184278.1 hypothetical protein [Shewanella nanhaiensis]
MIIRILLILSIWSISCVVSAAYICQGKVSGVSLGPKNGQLLAERIGPLSWPVLCSVSVDQNGVDTETCKVIFSTLIAAQMSQKDVTLWFNDGKDCSTDSHTPWGWLTGWYFGPKLVD